MNQGFSAPPINPLISIQPLTTPQPERDAVNVSKALLAIPNGTTVEGFVVNRDGQNNPILRTPLGDILIRSDFFLKTGSVVVFRVDNTQTTRARIVSVDGLMPSDYAATQTKLPVGDSIVKPALPASSMLASAPTNSANQAPADALTVQAILLSKTPGSSLTALAGAANTAEETAVPLMLQKLNTGSSLKITILKADLPLPLMQQPGTNAAPRSINQAAYASTQQDDIQELLHSAASQASSRQVGKAPSTTQPLMVEPANARSIPSQTAAPSSTTSTAPLTFQPVGVRTVAEPTPRNTTSEMAPSTASPTREASTLPTPQSATPSATTNPDKLTSPQQTSTTTIASPAAANDRSAVATHSGMPTAAAHAAYGGALRAQPSHAAPTKPYTPTSPANQTPSYPTATRNASTTNAPITTATIIGQEADGATILHTPHGTLKTFLPQPLPTGTSLQLRITPQTDAAYAAVTEEISSATQLMREWETLKETVQWAQSQEPLIGKVLLNNLPQVDNKLTSGLLFFIAALKGGDVQQWLGKNLSRALEVKGPDFLKKLKFDTAQMQQMLPEGQSQQWASANLPMVYQGELQMARLFYRRDQESSEEESQSNGASHRFIVEVGLSHLGDLQFDGFVRDGTKKRVFDLVIRSAKPLSDVIQNGIRSRFDEALSITGYQGYLTFQQGAQHFARPLSAVPAARVDTNTILA